MIYVTQGHERGVGLEIFFKSYLLLPKIQKKIIHLFVAEKTFNETLKILKLSRDLFSDLKISFTNPLSGFESTDSLVEALNLCTENDILITLPTSKDQLIHNNKLAAGYTEFFRDYFKNTNIAMTFKGLEQNLLLITDHIPLKEVTHKIKSQLIFDKTSLVLDSSQKYFSNFEEVIFAGINPHSGEGGLLGDEEKEIISAINLLNKSFAQVFTGPFPGDTLHFHINEHKKQLFVYMFHDQGLARFKSELGLIGLNITLGLPFLRLSVDHGTAFDLYGKNKANISSMIYLLNKAIEVHSHVNK